MKALAVNAATILVGGTLGLLIRNKLKKSLTDAILIGIGLFTVYIGVTGFGTGVSALVYLLALVLGGLIGTALKIEDGVDRLAKKAQDRLSRGDGEDRFAAGLTGFFIMSCAGAFTIVASFNAGLGNNTMLYTKSVMDLVVSMAMAASLGAGVLAAGVPILLYEGILVLCSGALAPVLSEQMLEAISCTGAILTVAIGANVLGVTKFKVMNYIPSLILAPLLVLLLGKVL